MSRITKTIEIPGPLLEQIKHELEVHAELIMSAKDSVSREHILFARSMTTLIDAVDARYNGGDHTLAHQWHSLERSDCSDAEEFAEKIMLLHALLNFGVCKVADIGRRDEAYPNSLTACYTVIDIDDALAEKIQQALPVLSAAREKKITTADMLRIRKFTVAIEALDERYTGVNLSSLPYGLSIAEKWNAILHHDGIPIPEDEYDDVYQKLYTILYAAARYKKVKVIYSSTGLRMYDRALHEEYANI